MMKTLVRKIEKNIFPQQFNTLNKVHILGPVDNYLAAIMAAVKVQFAM